jgi:hypothetical protein
MMTNENTTTRKINWSNVRFWAFTVACICSLLYFGYTSDKDQQAQQDEWTRVSCPSLLSIARSSRDTLIVMKVEPLCNSYVLDSLK